MTDPVIREAGDLLVDWFGLALAGRGSRPVESVAHFADGMGPLDGQSEALINCGHTSAHFAAMVDAAASHLAERDDVHNGSVFHPPTVAGYQVGIRIGELLGCSHYRLFHTTSTAFTLAAAAVGNLLGLDVAEVPHPFGSAGTQTAGLRDFLRTGADSKQFPTAHASSAGLMTAHRDRGGFTGAQQILEGPQGMAAYMSSDADPARLTDGLGTRWATVATSFKFHASCRHRPPADDALLQVMKARHLKQGELARVVTLVHQGAINVLGSVTDSAAVHQSKFAMGTVLALVARFGYAGLPEFDQHFRDEATLELFERISMELDGEVDRAYRLRWIGKVTATTNDGRLLQGRGGEPKGELGNALSCDEISTKVLHHAAYSGGARPAEVQAALEALWDVARCPKLEPLLRSVM